ncbi:MAG: bifunctional UDP-N-acetylglucosamine diphosphorylase/glucosamine-1-phosphate N-acetyltransferase GlmU [Gammaproteobacteria bacterium]|nr:bifunctional UDP-N-acetylglucosamine diphosphorylase/glucosamine-1-phosphate N-acetyltransferase GlmU [Gammaproteobacteria bacterium]MDE2250199.1 bifunctional UDP-N-acetylglucosamine diphosphorylase/glucosamine-1-phosphate N-acetyltransferase GlmU [Gammaproteobacteria bacterium]
MAAPSRPLSIVILAAGQGKRMKSDLPKVLQPLAGHPLLAHVLDAATALEPALIHVVYGHGGEAVRLAVRAENLRWVQQAEQLGTGHAVQCALPGIPDEHTVLVLYGDVPLIRTATLRTLLALVAPKRMALLTAKFDAPEGYGRIVRNAKGQVLRIVEQRDCSARERRIRECNTGVLAVHAKHLRRWLAQLRPANAQREYYLTDIVAMAVKDKVAIDPLVAPTAIEVQGVNDKLQLALLESEYRRARVHALMQAGVTVIDPARLDVRGSVSCGRDVVLDVNVILEGPVQLGDGVRIDANCVLSQVQVGSGTNIKPNCVIERAHIGAACEIGPFTRIRPETTLHDGVHLGNFVEVKKSDIGAGTKANHLAYIGDTTVGSRVNIGAGSVTCNYDGANKWRTQIGDGVFIGSGTMMVAPVKIGDGATIGAGSTITKDAPPGKLTLERSSQHTVEHWQRPVKQ